MLEVLICHEKIHLTIVDDRLVFLDQEDAVLRDPDCGDGVCAQPFEYASWGHSDHGCYEDCGAWESYSFVRVQLSLDASLPQEDVDEIRWNLFCTELEIFGIEFSVFEEDQVCASDFLRTYRDTCDATIVVGCKHPYGQLCIFCSWF